MAVGKNKHGKGEVLPMILRLLERISSGEEVNGTEFWEENQD